MDALREDVTKRCQGAEVFRLSYETTGVEYANNRLKGCSAKQSAGTAVRVSRDGKLGSAVQSGPCDASELAEVALATAPYGPKAWSGFAGPSTVEPMPALYDEREAAQTLDELVVWGGRVLDGLRKRWPDLVCSASASKATARVELRTTAGFEGELRTSSFGVGGGVQASREGDIFQWGSSLDGIPTDEELASFLERCHERIALGMTVADIEPGSWPVVLSPNSLSLMLRVLEAGVKGDAIHEKKSPLAGKTGELILSPRVTIHDDPTWGRTGKTVPFDDEGIPARRRAVVDAGVFTGPLTNLEFAAKLGVEPTGNCFREQHIYRHRVLASGGHIAGGNWRMAGGDTALADLLASVDRGIYVEGSFDCWMGNIVNGDFAGTLHQAYLIEKGRLVGRLKHRAFSGNIYQVLGERLADLSREVEQPTNGFDTLEAPHVLVSSMDIS